MSMRTAAALLFTLGLLVVSCAEGDDARPRPAAAPDSVGDSSSVTANRKLVSTARLVIEVDEPDGARARVEEVTAAKGGFAERVEARGSDRSRDSFLVLRVPAEHLDAVLSEIRTLAREIKSETRGVRDVTDQSIDIEARLAGLKATEKELLALLDDSRARESGVQEIMAVHHELTEIRTRIEAIEGEQKALEGLVSFATIELEIRTGRTSGLLALTFRPLKFAGACLQILVAILKLIGYALIFVILVVVPIGLLIAIPLRILIRRWGRRMPPLPPADASYS
jgi:Domain of unknown function (DUF4349)